MKSVGLLLKNYIMGMDMLRNRSVAVKFFLVFFLTSAIAISSMMLVVYSAVKNHIIDTRIVRLEIIHKIKAKQLQNAINNVQNPVLKFLKNNTDAYGFYKIVNAYNNLPNGISDKTVEACRQKLSENYESLFEDRAIFEYLKITPSDAVPVDNAGIIAQCIDLMSNMGIESFRDINDNVPSIKEYKDLYKYFSNAFSLLLDTVGLEDILFVSADDNVVYTPGKGSVLGHNLISSYWIKGLAHQISKFHSMSSDEGNKNFFLDMQPYMALDGYPVFFVMTPVFKNDKYDGCIVLVLSSLFIDSILSDSNNWQKEGLGFTGDSYVTSLNGVFRSNKRDLVERSDEYIEALKKSGASPVICKLVEQFGTVAYYSSILGTPPIDAFEGNEGYGFYKTTDGSDIIMYYAPLNLGDFHWVLYIRAELSEIVGEIASVRSLMFKLAIPIVLFLLIITIAFAYFITNPIRQLKKSCIAIAKGEASSIDVQNSYLEINDLMKSFDEMVSTLIENERQTEDVKKTLEDSLLNQAVIAQTLKEEKDFITHILDAEGFYMLVVNQDNQIVRTNSEVNAFDFAKNLVGRSIDEIVPDKYKSQIASIFSLVRGGHVQQVQHLITESIIKGKNTFIEWNFTAFEGKDFDSGRATQFIVVVGVNITERYEAEKNSKENAAMFHKIFSSAYDAILIADEDNHILLVNQSFEKLFNIEYVDLVGKPVIGNIVSNEYRNVILSGTQEGKSIEIEAIRSNLSTFPVDMSISKIMYHGKLSVLYIFRDSSIRKRKEKELQISLKQAKESERMKSEFLSSVSYEIHTQLNGIIGFVDLLKETNLDDIQKEYLKIINTSSGCLFNIVNDVLDYTKIENGNMQLDVIEFNAWSLFEDAINMFASKAMSKNILLMCMYKVDMPRYFLGDPLRIRQMLSNLISNAVKFTDAGGRVIMRAMLTSKNNETCKIRVSIKDNGIGITKEQQKKILDTFCQSGFSINQCGGSSGIGLAITKSLAQFMNSSLNVYSEIGKGSEFYFTLDLPVVEKKDIQSRVDFSETCVVLLGKDPDSPVREFYEEYIQSVKAQVRFTTKVSDIRSDDVKIIGLNYDNNSYETIKKVVNEFSDKSFIIFSTTFDDKIYDIDNTNVYQLVAPLTISKLVAILSDILGYKKSSLSRSDKQKKLSFSGKILLVDDNEVNRKLAEIHLKNVGLDVDVAENGQEAVDKYKQAAYDMVFMDVYMPVKDGLTATKEILEYEKEKNLHHVPIVALTANIDEHDIEECIKSGMDDFIAKPIVKSKIEAVLHRYLDKEQALFNKTLIANVAEYLKSNDPGLIVAALEEYYRAAWHYVQNLFYTTSEYNERSSLYIIEKIHGLSEKYKISLVISVLDKIKQNIEIGMNEEIFVLIDELKDTIHKIKYSIRMLQ